MANDSHNFMLQRPSVALKLFGGGGLLEPELCSFSRILDKTHRDQLSTGFLIYGPLCKKGLGTQHSLSSDIESRLPSMEMWVVCYGVKAYLHCAAQLSVVATACLLALALKFIFALGAVCFRCERDIFRERCTQDKLLSRLGLCGYI